ncbi:hypothetical protein GW17_00035588 [Ensete ventricosum]|nr:hypothetical protein GW17_00035588 [Ensete ventricosum]
MPWYHPVHTGPAADRYADRPLPGGTVKIDRQRSIEGEIDRWRSIEEEKGKRKKKEEEEKKKKEEEKYLARTPSMPAGDFSPLAPSPPASVTTLATHGSRVTFLPARGEIEVTLESRLCLYSTMLDISCRYVDRPLTGDSAKNRSSAVDFDRRRPIEHDTYANLY